MPRMASFDWQNINSFEQQGPMHVSQIYDSLQTLLSYLLLHQNRCFWSSQISPCSLARVPRTQNVTDATLISEQRDWHNYSARFQACEVATSVSISHCCFMGCSTFSSFSFGSNKRLQKGGETLPFKSVTGTHRSPPNPFIFPNRESWQELLNLS